MFDPDDGDRAAFQNVGFKPKIDEVDHPKRFYRSRVGNPVAKRHKWRIGHENVAFCQIKELSNFALNFLMFFNLTNLFHYLRLMAVVTE
jgi:hypothetical protein